MNEGTGLAALDATVRKSDQWRREWYRTIGGSAAAAALGVDKYRTRRQLWEEMTLVIHHNQLPPAKPPSDDMRRGALLETVARQATERYLGAPIEPHDQAHFCYHAAYPFAHCLPDGFVEWQGARWVWENKVPRPATIAKVMLGGLPEHWHVQAQHNIVLTGAAGCLFTLFDPLAASVHVLEVLPDAPPKVNAILEGERQFYRMVMAQQPIPDVHAPGPDEPLDAAAPDRLILDGDAAKKAALHYARLKRLHDETGEALEKAKLRLATLAGCRVTADGLLLDGADVFEVPGVLRVIHKAQAGAKVFDKEKALAAFQDLRDERFWKRNKSSRPWKAYLQGEAGE